MFDKSKELEILLQQVDDIIQRNILEDFKGELETSKITVIQIVSYKEKVIELMLEKGASEDEIRQVTDIMIQTSMLNNHTPEDMAWALMQ